MNIPQGCSNAAYGNPQFLSPKSLPVGLLPCKIAYYLNTGNAEALQSLVVNSFHPNAALRLKARNFDPLIGIQYVRMYYAAMQFCFPDIVVVIHSNKIEERELTCVMSIKHTEFSLKTRNNLIRSNQAVAVLRPSCFVLSNALSNKLEPRIIDQLKQLEAMDTDISVGSYGYIKFKFNKFHQIIAVSAAFEVVEIGSVN